MGRTATWDIYCHAFMMGAIYYLYLALRQNTCKWTYFIGAGIFMGLSFLGKGPVSFYALLLPFVCAYILYYRKETQMKGKWIALAVMILIGIVLSTWWYAIFISIIKRWLPTCSTKSLLPGVITTYVPGIITGNSFWRRVYGHC